MLDPMLDFLRLNIVVTNLLTISKATHALLLLTICCLPISVIGENAKIGGDFDLTSQLNQPYSLSDTRGKVAILFFGFTHCPDVCPNTLGTIETVLSQLGEKAQQVQPIFISVDPQRDKPEVLQSYLQYFGNNYIGLTGTSEQVDKVVKQYQGFYSYKGDTGDDSYSVDHTSNLYIIDTLGQVTNIIPYGLPPQAITKAINKILDEVET